MNGKYLISEVPEYVSPVLYSIGEKKINQDINVKYKILKGMLSAKRNKKCLSCCPTQ